MRIRKSALDAVREYAEAHGCTEWDEECQRFYAPDRKRSVRFTESRADCVFVWDTGVPIGRVMLDRRAS